IGLSGVFSLTRWCWQIPTGRLRPRGTQDAARPGSLTYTWLSHAMAPVFHRGSTSLTCNHIAVLQPRPCRNMAGLGSFPFARHYSGNHCYFRLLSIRLCFSLAGLMFIVTCLQHAGLSHSEIHVSSHMCCSLWLIAVYHVLHRL